MAKKDKKEKKAKKAVEEAPVVEEKESEVVEETKEPEQPEQPKVAQWRVRVGGEPGNYVLFNTRAEAIAYARALVRGKDVIIYKR